MNENAAKKKILIVEDNALNRAMLVDVLSDDYDILLANDGLEGLASLREHYRELAVVLLDLIMPNCDGFEFMKTVRKESTLASVPIVVLTSSFSVEVEEECLALGAIDFLLKPFNTAILKRRIKGILHMRETAAFITKVGVDELTGLYSKQAFFYYAKQFLDEHSNQEFDLTILDIENLRIVNSIYGEIGGDELLKHTAHKIKVFSDDEMICGRYDGDKFVSFTPSIKDEKREILIDCMKDICDTAPIPNVIVSCGVYEKVDRNLSISAMCDRAAFALKTAKHNFEKPYAIYDKVLSEEHERTQLYEARFENALKNDEFEVWYQPKFEAKTEKLEGFEALVRWIDADGKMISPGEFIPMFEKDGLIARLDEYVFRKTCETLRKRHEEGKKVYPVSVNLSRVSLFSENVIERYANIVNEVGIQIEMIPIELTESATILSLPIESRTDELKGAGFHIYMDDFGSGVSSLASFIGLPFDTVKLDKSLVDYIGDPNGNEMIRHTIEMAHFKNMKVVAEGVETWDQLAFLKEISCDLIQGYYFSAPKPYAEIDQLIDLWEEKAEEQAAQEIQGESKTTSPEKEHHHRMKELRSRLTITQSLGKFFFSAYYIDMSDFSFEEIHSWSEARELINTKLDAPSQLEVMNEHMVLRKYRKPMRTFTNLNNLQERMAERDILSLEFQGLNMEWGQANFIVDDRDEDGKILHVLFACRSIQEEKERELAYEKSQQELTRRNLKILEGLGETFIAVYEVDLEENRFDEITANDFLHEKVGESGNARKVLSFIGEKLVKPAYLSGMRLFNDFDTLPKRLLKKQSDAYLFEGITNGWTQAVWNVAERDEDGVPTKVLLVFKSMEAAKAKEKIRNNQNFIFEALSQEYEDLFLVDLEQNIQYTYKAMDRAAVNPHERSRNYAEAIVFYIDNYVVAHDRERIKEALAPDTIKQYLLENGDYQTVFEIEYEGNRHFRQATYIMPYFYDEDMDPNLIVMGYKQADMIVADERARSEELRVAKERAEHDPLTGLLNKGVFDGLLEEYHANDDTAIVILDLDHFKTINDTYGHAMGDAVLQFASECIKDSFRASDYIARIGGDEFAVVMPSIDATSKDVIMSRVDNLRKSLKAGATELPEVSVSVGVAFSDADTKNNAKELFRHADLALYNVKENGRNGIAFYEKSFAK